LRTNLLLKPPAKSTLLLEARVLRDILTMSVPLAGTMFGKTKTKRRQTVMVIPGFGADDRATWPVSQPVIYQVNIAPTMLRPLQRVIRSTLPVGLPVYLLPLNYRQWAGFHQIQRFPVESYQHLE